MSKLCVALVLCVCLCDARLLPAQEPATRPADYGAESYRLVASADEIVSVLEMA